jgi:hypothetical protein
MRISPKLSVARILSFAAAAVLSPPLAAAVPAQAQAASWTVVSSPNASAGNNHLAAVASLSASDVWTVGSADNAVGNAEPLAEHWDGTAWSIIPTPSVLTGSLSGVAAVASDDVWAAGSLLLSSRGDTAQFEHWNGRKWIVAKKSPAVGGAAISGMAAVSSTDVWAVGRSLSTGGVAQTLIEHWNGKAWAVVPSPNASTQNNQLAAVAAISANDVWAVGDFQNASNAFQTLTEHWDGTSWSIVASPSGAGPQAGLLGVAAVSTSDVWAVGDSGSGTLIEHWNGISWTVVPSPSPAGTVANLLFGAAVVSASNIWAVGESQNSTSGIPQTLIEQWDGTSWSIVASPSPGSASSLSGASADRSSGQAWAVGSFRAASGADQTLTEFNP